MYWRAVGILTAAVALMATPAAAQIGLGGHFVRAADAFDGSNGIGARLRAGLPLIPVSAAINGEYFFADCDPGDCSLYGVTVDVNYSFPIPVLQPFAGIGWSIRKVEDESGERTERGLNVGIGAELRLPGIRPYADLRYEFADAPEKQLLLRVGLLLR